MNTPDRRRETDRRKIHRPFAHVERRESNRRATRFQAFIWNARLRALGSRAGN